MTYMSIEEGACHLTELPPEWCACPGHARPSSEPTEAPMSTPRDEATEGPNRCLTCDSRLVRGETYLGVFCSWLCGLGATA